ncbi:hypothetical protein SAMN06298216_3866 [Spirosomataceae bacterium TFI 002]|nr:hypothetical protein SAMN06298216_3866 [Spirosomataceae bacterium TFI 002]
MVTTHKFLKSTILSILIVISGIVSSAYAQADSTKYSSVSDFMKKGTVSGSSRSYYMYTDNQKGLTDYHGLATGAGIAYQTPVLKGFSAGFSGYFIANLHSSDFEVLDEATQNPNRYELGLFDVTNPNGKKELTRLEELWVKYQKKNTQIMYGRYVPKNMFINGQDGRMRPTMVQGLSFATKIRKNDFEAQWITKMSPRSTVNWYKVADTFGIYPVGRNKDGSTSGYEGNTTTPGILIVENTNRQIRNLKLTTGFISVPNVFQTYYVNPEIKLKKWEFGLMTVAQHQLANGGSAEMVNSYSQESDKPFILSGQIAHKIGKQRFAINYTLISANGRFLMPREWGREPFYTFMPRERNEGAGNVNAISTNYNLAISSQFKLGASYGFFKLPNASDPVLNKYALPSYSQFNVQLDYVPQGVFKGLAFRALYVRKDGADSSIENPKFIFNKINLSIVNLILNYNF